MGIKKGQSVPFTAQTAKPVLASTQSQIYSKTVSGVVELFVEDSLGNEIQITNAGSIAAAGFLGSLWWNTSSNTDGSYTGSDTVFSGTFTALIDRVNKWNGTVSSNIGNLPVVGAGDHNRVVGFVEHNGSSSKDLTVTASGTSKINSGGFHTLASISVRGAGSFNLFRYDASFDIWEHVGGAYSLGSQEVNATANVQNISIIPLPSLSNNDIFSGGNKPSNVLSLQPVAPFTEVTGIDSSASSAPGFNPLRLLWNSTQYPLILRTSNVSSLSANRMSHINDRVLLSPSSSCWAWWDSSGPGPWRLFGLSSQGLEVRRGIQTSNVTDVSYDGELILVDASASTITVSAPLGLGTFYTGQRFGVKLLSGTDLIVDGNGQSIEDPNTGIVSTSQVIGTTSGFFVQWRWDGSAWRVM